MTDYVENQKYRRQLAQRIKDKSDCREIFRTFWPGHYRENGNSLCPFHDDCKPSLQLSKELAYCHSDKKAFDAIDLYALANGITKAEAILALSEKMENSIPTALPSTKESSRMKKDFKQEFVEFSERPLSDTALAYLSNGG